MGIGTEVFTMPNCKFKAVCLNPVTDPEKIREISERYYNALIFALETTYGERWGSIVMKKMIELHPELEEEFNEKKRQLIEKRKKE